MNASPKLIIRSCASLKAARKKALGKARVLTVKKCSQCFRKTITAPPMLVEFVVCQTPTGVSPPPPPAPSSHRETRTRRQSSPPFQCTQEPHQSSWARPQCPCGLVCYSPPKVNYSGGFKGLAWPSVRDLKVKVWNSCQAKWKNKQTDQSAQCLLTPSSTVVSGGGNDKLMSYWENSLQLLGGALTPLPSNL